MTDPEPRHVGGYALRERVGAGVSGETFRARDGAFGREVAVKILSGPLSGDAALVQALEAKARLVMRLDHPNVASLLDYGSDDGAYFIVTEFVHGRSLDRIVKEDGPVSVNQAIDTATEIAAALHAGHSIGLVHGGLRLSGIMYTYWGETKLTGFGVVPPLEGHGGSSAKLADPRPPGRWREAPPGPASDSDAVGAVLYELLTSRPPAAGAVEPPSVGNPDVPPELDEIVVKALGPESGTRFGNVYELAAALRRFRGGHLERLVWGEEAPPPAPPVQNIGPPSPPEIRRADSPSARAAGWRRATGSSEEDRFPEPVTLAEEKLWTGAGEGLEGNGMGVGVPPAKIDAGEAPAAQSAAPGEVDLRNMDPFEEESRADRDGAAGSVAASEVDLGAQDEDPFEEEARADRDGVPGSVAASEVDLGPRDADPFEDETRTVTEVLDRPNGNGAVAGRATVPAEPPQSRHQVIDLDRDEVEAGAPGEPANPGAAGAKIRARPVPKSRPRGRLRSGSSARWARRAVVLVCVAVLADFAYVGATVVTSLRDAGGGIRAGISELRRGRYNGAKDTFTDANGASARALGAMDHPSYRLASALPWIERDSLALRSLAEGSRLSAVAGETATDAIVAMGAPPAGAAAAIYRNGTVQFDALEVGAPLVGPVRDALDDAAMTLAGAPEANLASVRDAVSVATERVEGARETAAKVETLTDVLPSLFGEGTARRYLLVFQASSQSRGSGGVIAFYGILEAKNGRIKVGNVRPIDFLGDVSADPGAAPGWFDQEYGRFGAFDTFEQANLSPSFSVVAPVLENLYESAIGVSVDGVVGMDPTALGELASVTGPIEQPGYGVKLDTDNTADVLNHDVYLHFSGRPDDRDTYVAGVIEEFWRRMSSPSARVGALPSSLPSVVASQHFKVYSGIPKDERSLADLEADGDYRSQGSAVQAVFHNNLTDNKIDYFLERRVDTSIQLGTEGRAAVTTEATMENAAVAGPSSDFLGAGNKPSTNRMRLSFLLPRRAKVKGYGRNDNRVSYETGEEGGFPLVSDDVKVPAGETVAATLDYTMRIAALRKDRGTFRITLFPHGTITPDELSLEISPPGGYSFTTPDGPGTLEANGTFFYSGSATAPVEVELQLVRD